MAKRKKPRPAKPQKRPAPKAKRLTPKRPIPKRKPRPAPARSRQQADLPALHASRQLQHPHTQQELHDFEADAAIAENKNLPGFFIAGIGASAGGLEACSQVLA